MLPQITRLDGRSIYELGVVFQSQNPPPLIPPTWGQSQAPVNAAGEALGDRNVSNSFLAVRGLADYDHQPVMQQIQGTADMNRQLQYEGYRGKLEDNFSNLVPLHNMPVAAHPGLPQANSQFQMLQPTSEHIAAAQGASQFHEQLTELTGRLSTAIKERDMTLKKFEENEQVWTKKLDKIQKDHQSMVEMNSSLKDDNKDLLIQIDKYIKRVKQLENQIEREAGTKKETELQVHDYRRDKEAL